MIHYKEFDFTKYVKKSEFYTKKDKYKVTRKFSNVIVTLDFETTSYFLYKDKPDTPILFDKNKTNEFYSKCEKQSTMYIWMLGINNHVLYGRTFQELEECIYLMMKSFKEINKKEVRQIIYIHNLSFDFQFLRNILNYELLSVFARDNRKPITAFYNLYDSETLTKNTAGIEFRCSFFLTNMSLNACSSYFNTTVKKLVGDLDYNVMRTPLTSLTEEEKGYCENDILVLYEVIKHYLNEYEKLEKIPLTQTGKIRRKLRKMLQQDYPYMMKIKNITPSLYGYELLIQAYSGGYTHANARHVNKTIKNVQSWDITSSYPFEMVTKKFPMEKFKSIDLEYYKSLDKDEYAFIFDVTMHNVKRNKKVANTYLSVSKRLKFDVDGNDIIADYVVIDNGRIESIEKCRYILTDCDYEIVKQVYDFDLDIDSLTIYAAKKDYLDKRIIEFNLENYFNKTTFKDIEGKEQEYKTSKEYINSIYGLFVQKQLNDEISFEENEWKINYCWDPLNEEYTDLADEQMDQARNSNFLSYSWGVWVTAYARKHLWDIILQINEDLVYSDTDSVKFVGEHSDVFESDNERVFNDIKKVCEHYNIDEELYSPVDQKGIKRTLGLFDYEETYVKFRTLGAKKYCYEHLNKKTGENELGITVSGLNKKTALNGLNSIEEFTLNKVFDYDTAGKKELYYIDDQREIKFSDGYVSKEKYGICLKPTTYTLNMTLEYQELTKSINRGSIRFN